MLVLPVQDYVVRIWTGWSVHKIGMEEQTRPSGGSAASAGMLTGMFSYTWTGVRVLSIGEQTYRWLCQCVPSTKKVVRFFVVVLLPIQDVLLEHYTRTSKRK